MLLLSRERTDKAAVLYWMVERVAHFKSLQIKTLLKTHIFCCTIDGWSEFSYWVLYTVFWVTAVTSCCRKKVAYKNSDCILIFYLTKRKQGMSQCIDLQQLLSLVSVIHLLLSIDVQLALFLYFGQHQSLCCLQIWVQLTRKTLALFICTSCSFLGNLSCPRYSLSFSAE